MDPTESCGSRPQLMKYSSIITTIMVGQWEKRDAAKLSLGLGTQAVDRMRDCEEGSSEMLREHLSIMR